MPVQVAPSFLRRSSLMTSYYPSSGAKSLFCDVWNTLLSTDVRVNTRGEPMAWMVSFSRRIHIWDLKPVVSMFNGGVRTFYM